MKPLSRLVLERMTQPRPVTVKMAYGFCAPPARSTSWDFAPQMPFRASRVLLWPAAGEKPVIEALDFEGDNQLIHPMSAEVFGSWMTLGAFVDRYLEHAEHYAGATIRARLDGMPSYFNFHTPPEFPTLSVGGQFRARWTGKLRGIFVCGEEVVAAPPGSTGEL